MTEKMLIIGLTGGIGMGKSTAARILRGFDVPVYDADQAVHQLLRRGGAAVKAVARLFPEAFRRGAIDRKILARLVFGNPRRLRQLENILHPLVRQMEKNFLRMARKQKAKAAILEIPLLFETHGEKRCDLTLCVTAPPAIQKARVLRRPGMTKARFYSILKHQMPNPKRLKKADIVVDTGVSRRDTKRQLEQVINNIAPAPDS